MTDGIKGNGLEGITVPYTTTIPAHPGGYQYGSNYVPNIPPLFRIAGMPEPHTINKLCLEPFPDKSVKTELLGQGEFKVAKATNTKTNLVKLKVLKTCYWTVSAGHTECILANSYVWIRASEYASPWGKEILTAGEERFIMVPPDRIEFTEPM
jgi:hypothetical protein